MPATSHTTQPSQEVINAMVVNHQNQLVELRHTVYGNGEVGMAESVRTMRAELQEFIQEQKDFRKSRDEKEAEERKRREKFIDQILVAVVLGGLGFITSFIVVMVRLYPFLERLLTQITISP